MSKYHYKLEIEIIDDELIEEEELETFVKQAIELHLECLVATAKLKSMDRVMLIGAGEVVEA